MEDWPEDAGETLKVVWDPNDQEPYVRVADLAVMLYAWPMTWRLRLARKHLLKTLDDLREQARSASPENTNESKGSAGYL